MVLAAFSAGLAERPGMAAMSWLADLSAGTGPALANGYAAPAACIVLAMPYLAWHGAASVGLVACIAVLVAWLRPETGATSWAQTFGVLGAAGVLAVCTSLWLWPTLAVVTAAGAARIAWGVPGAHPRADEHRLPSEDL